MEMTKKLPTEPGYYWWTNFGEHNPTIMRVRESDGKLYADNGEYFFEIENEEPDQGEFPFEDERDEDMLINVGNETYECAKDELWSERIPWPVIGGEVIDYEF